MTPHEPKNPRVALLEDHQHIEALLERLTAAVSADERETYEEQWRETEKALLTHLDVEEMFVFPALAATHGSEVERLSREHATIRREIGEIGVALDLHVLRASTIEAFCRSLREHAKREEALAYAEAERRLPVKIARAIVDRITATAATRTKPNQRPPVARSGP